MSCADVAQPAAGLERFLESSKPLLCCTACLLLLLIRTHQPLTLSLHACQRRMISGAVRIGRQGSEPDRTRGHGGLSDDSRWKSAAHFHQNYLGLVKLQLKLFILLLLGCPIRNMLRRGRHLLHLRVASPVGARDAAVTSLPPPPRTSKTPMQQTWQRPSLQLQRGNSRRAVANTRK